MSQGAVPPAHKDGSIDAHRFFQRPRHGYGGQLSAKKRGEADCGRFLGKCRGFGCGILRAGRRWLRGTAYPEEYAGHNWHPMFLEGTKSIAYELWEQNGFRAPENIICAAETEARLLAFIMDFRICLKISRWSFCPSFCGSGENCNLIYREFVGDMSDDSFLPTIAEGIALRSPNKGRDVVNAVKTTAGRVLCAEEEEIASAVKELAGLGFYVEPTSAAAYAGAS